jgi:hypothetical protein
MLRSLFAKTFAWTSFPSGRPGNVHSAEHWDDLLVPEIERREAEGKRVAFRADAAFARPEVYECRSPKQASG